MNRRIPGNSSPSATARPSRWSLPSQPNAGPSELARNLRRHGQVGPTRAIRGAHRQKPSATMTALSSRSRPPSAARSPEGPGSHVGHRQSRTGLGPTTRSIRASTVASRLALVPAHPEHFDWIAQMLRDGAAEGSFDAELRTDSIASRVFFENLRRTLLTGYFLDEGSDGSPAQVPASGYVLVLTKGRRTPYRSASRCSSRSADWVASYGWSRSTAVIGAGVSARRCSKPPSRRLPACCACRASQPRGTRLRSDRKGAGGSRLSPGARRS